MGTEHSLQRQRMLLPILCNVSFLFSAKTSGILKEDPPLTKQPIHPQARFFTSSPCSTLIIQLSGFRQPILHKKRDKQDYGCISHHRAKYLKSLLLLLYLGIQSIQCLFDMLRRIILSEPETRSFINSEKTSSLSIDNSAILPPVSFLQEKACLSNILPSIIKIHFLFLLLILNEQLQKN